MEEKTFLVAARWDPEAGVFVAESDDVPGLITEAESREALVAKLRVMIPELLELNGGQASDPSNSSLRAGEAGAAIQTFFFTPTKTGLLRFARNDGR